MEEPKDHRKAIITFLAVAIIAVIVVTAIVASPKNKSTDTSSSAPTSSTTNTSGTPPDTSTANSSDTSFKDGSYTATGSYVSPGGNENITVHVTLQNGIITATSADPGANVPEASEYQGMFISGYKSLVLGKDISDVHLSRVSGSSLTSQGFNEAISQIENEAKA